MALQSHSPNPRLNYEAVARALSRRMSRRILVITTTIGLIVLGWTLGPTALARVQLLYLQRACLSHSDPPTSVVLTSDGAVHSGMVDPTWARMYQLLSPPGF